MAERVGFEPTVRFPVRSLSRRVLSTTQSPLRSGYKTWILADLSWQRLWREEEKFLRGAPAPAGVNDAMPNLNPRSSFRRAWPASSRIAFLAYTGWKPLFTIPDLTFTNPWQLGPYLLLALFMVLLAMLYTRSFSGAAM